MPFDSEGNFTRIHSWEDDRVNDIDIVTDHADEEDDNFADGLSQTYLRDGRVAMRGNMDMASFQIKNLGRGALDGDAVNINSKESWMPRLKAFSVLAMSRLLCRQPITAAGFCATDRLSAVRIM